MIYKTKPLSSWSRDQYLIIDARPLDPKRPTGGLLIGKLVKSTHPQFNPSPSETTWTLRDFVPLAEIKELI